MDMDRLFDYAAGAEKLFVLEDQRLNSFKEWPFSKKDACSIEKMAEAGFYWAGTKDDPDSAACFICGKVLDGWESTDDPWDEHVKHAPQCSFARLAKAQKDVTVGEFLDFFFQAIKNNETQRFTKMNLKLQGDIEKSRSKIV